MFKNPQDEDHICQILRAYVEEFGPENVVVALPESWKHPNYSLGRTKLEFTKDNEIEVRVEIQNSVLIKQSVFLT